MRTDTLVRLLKRRAAQLANDGDVEGNKALLKFANHVAKRPEKTVKTLAKKLRELRKRSRI